MAAVINPSPEPTRTDTLLELLTRGGSASVSLVFGPLNVYFIVPQDQRRTYIGFSLPNPADTLTIHPGEDAPPAGFTLHREQSIMEWAGSTVDLLVKGCWRVTADAGQRLDITVLRK